MDYIAKPFQIEIVRARVRNLLALHHARHTLQLALGSARLGIWQWELNGDHVWFDNSMPSPLGYAAGEMPNGPQDWADFVHPDDLLGLELCRQKLRRNVPHFEIKLRLRNKQDTWTWVLVAGETLKRTGQKNTIIGTFRDIQRRKQTEQALAAREAELSTLIAALPDMILTLDMSGDISHCHLPAETEGWPAFDCKPGQSLTQALPHELSGQLVQHIVDLMSGGGSRQFNADIEQNGQHYRLNIKITRREDKEGYPIGFLLIIRNLFQADTTLGNPASIV
jgi:PAS domain S-box-containing protein